MGLIYLDACLLIYLVERHARWGEVMEKKLTEAADARFGISPLVKCECLVGPMKRGDLVLEQAYMQVFERFLPFDIPEAIYLDAARLRARFGVRAPDALHLSCAQHHRCDALWTNDERLARASHGLAVNVFA